MCALGAAVSILLGIAMATAPGAHAYTLVEQTAAESALKDLTDGCGCHGAPTPHEEVIVERFREQLDRYGTSYGNDGVLAASEDTLLTDTGVVTDAALLDGPLSVVVPFSGPLVVAGVAVLAGAEAVGELTSLFDGIDEPIAAYDAYLFYQPEEPQPEGGSGNFFGLTSLEMRSTLVRKDWSPLSDKGGPGYEFAPCVGTLGPTGGVDKGLGEPPSPITESQCWGGAPGTVGNKVGLWFPTMTNLYKQEVYVAKWGGWAGSFWNPAHLENPRTWAPVDECANTPTLQMQKEGWSVFWGRPEAYCVEHVENDECPGPAPKCSELDIEDPVESGAPGEFYLKRYGPGQASQWTQHPFTTGSVSEEGQAVTAQPLWHAEPETKAEGGSGTWPGIQHALEQGAATEQSTGHPTVNAIWFAAITAAAESSAVVPDCTNLAVEVCVQRLKEFGFENLTVKTASENSAEVEPGNVVTTSPSPGTETQISTPVEIQVNPERTIELPVPQPNELATTYRTTVETAGFPNVTVQVLPEGSPYTNPYVGPEGVAHVTPQPGQLYAPATTDVNILENPVNAPAALPGGPPGPLKFLDPPGIKFPELRTPCNVFPFGVPCWFAEQVDSFVATRRPPEASVTFPIVNATMHLKFSEVEGTMEIVRLVEGVVSCIGIVLLFGRFASSSAGSSDGGGGGGEDDE